MSRVYIAHKISYDYESSSKFAFYTIDMYEFNSTIYSFKSDSIQTYESS